MSFDLKILKEKLLKEGLPEIEDLAEKVYKAVSDFAKEGAAVHPNAVVKAVVPAALIVLDPLVLGQLDKIDGKVG